MEATESRTMISLIFYRYMTVLFSFRMSLVYVMDSLKIQDDKELSQNWTFTQTDYASGTEPIAIRSDWLHKGHSLNLTFEKSSAKVPGALHEHIQFFRLCCVDWLIPSLPQVTCFVAMCVMAVMLWYQRKRIAVLKTEMMFVMSERRSSGLPYQVEQIQANVAEKQRRCLRNVETVTSVNKRVENAYIKLDKVKELHDLLYEDIRYWKQTWINQTAKLRQISPEQLQAAAKLQNSDAEKLHLHKKAIHKFIAETEFQFDDAFHKLKWDHKVLGDIFKDISCLKVRIGIHPERGQGRE